MYSSTKQDTPNSYKKNKSQKPKADSENELLFLKF